MVRSNKGFTLVEMIVVLVLLSIIGVAVIPSMEMIYKQEIRKAANALCLDLKTLREQARLTGKTYSLVVGVDDHTYTMTGDGTQVLRSGNKENSKNIKYEIIGDDGNTTKTIKFMGKIMINEAKAPIDKYTITVHYIGVASHAEITFENLTGRYTVDIKS